MKKKFIIIAVLTGVFLGVAAIGYSEQLSKIGLIDIGKIASQYFRESGAYRELENLISSYEAEKNTVLNNISQLEAKKLDAENSGNETLKLQIEDEIYNKKQYLKELNRIRVNQIQSQRNKLTESKTFLSEMMKEIEYIAESEGYSVIIKSSDPNIIWWSQEIDITDLVLDRLMKKAAAKNN